MARFATTLYNCETYKEQRTHTNTHIDTYVQLLKIQLYATK